MTEARGRPRDPTLDAAILAATLRQLAEGGYDSMSITAVAEDAGVSRPTVYRRWPTKADLAVSALATLQASEPPPETGDTRADLVAYLGNFRRSIERPYGMSMIGTLLVEEETAPQLIRLFREKIVAGRRAMLRRVLDAARDRGELRADADLDAAVDMLVGAYYAHYLAGTPFAADWAATVVATVLDGIGGRGG